MALLFLDPLVLGLLLGLLVLVWLVWRGTFRGWFGRPDAWTTLVWPLPVVALLLPAPAGGLLAGLRYAGVEIGDGAISDAALYLIVYTVPLLALTVWPPLWLLPAWSRSRLAAFPGPDEGAPYRAVPAVNARRAGHGSRARWVWRVDGVPGCVWLDGDRLLFRASPEAARASVDGTWEVDDDALTELRFSTDDDLRLEPPRGGWWTRTHLDVDLAAVDRWCIRARRPRKPDGLLTIQVDGRPTVHLWVADVRELAARMPEPVSSPPRAVS